MNKFLKKALFYNNYGYLYLILNIAFAIFPLITSILNKSNAWTVTVTLLVIYLISYILTYVSEEQHKKLNRPSYSQSTFKALNFIFSFMAVLVYIIVDRFVRVPLEMLYIFSTGLTSLIALYWMILNEYTNNVHSSWDKIKIYIKTFKALVIGDKTNSFKGILKGIIFTVCIFCFILLVALINIYKFGLKLELLKHFFYN